MNELFDTRPKVKSHKLNVLPQNPEPDDPTKAVGRGRFPSWLHRKLPKGKGLAQTDKIITTKRLHTVCEEAKCPNLTECWSRKTATFLVMGKSCTRACGFCDIDFSKTPAPLDPLEPKHVAESVEELGLKHVVITQVARDDLDDGGANHLVNIIHAIREKKPSVTIEVLTSDFHENEHSWDLVLAAKPEIFNYNIETVKRLTPRVRHTATYERTLKLLKHVKENKLNPKMWVKSGLMVGLGETEQEVKETIFDLHSVGVDIITIGQYLQPNRHKLRVKSFVTPEQFKQFETYGYSLGVKQMYCGPLVRSSYNADIILKEMK